MDHTGDAVADAVDDTTRDERRIGYIGKNLGRFAIRAELGRGGMATVYRAHDPQLGRDVAIKVMHGFFAGRTELEARFRREANAVAGIRHPSVLALYDFSPPRGEEPGYLVTELIDGPDLRQVIDARRGHLMPEAAILFGAQIADALGAVHAAGVVHRDVKPDNVLIDRGGQAEVEAEGATEEEGDEAAPASARRGVPRVLLTDFGVAHVGALDTMTATGAVLGSPAYMSPEQARGDEVGPSSDVFSLGVVLYQMCTGHLPFCGKDPLTTLSAILHGELTRPAKLDSHVGPELEAVILRCLDRDPRARYAHGGSVASALRALLVGAGLADEGAALRAFLRNPAEFERGLAPRVASQALEAAERARRQRQGARALAELGRALAYAPQDARAQLLLRQMASGNRQWKRTGGWAAGGLLFLGGAVVAVVIVNTTGERKLLSSVPKGAASVAAVAVAVAAGTASATKKPTAIGSGIGSGIIVHSSAMPLLDGNARTHPATAKHKAASDAFGRGSIRGQEGARATGTVVRSDDPQAPVRAREAESEPEGDRARGGVIAAGDRFASAAPVAPGVEAVAKGPPSDRLGGRPRPAIAQAGIALRASHGFCEPSLDEHLPSLRATYAGLDPGLHDVYCTLPQGGPKVLVTRYDLKAGTRPNLSIVPDADGNPILARPE